MAPQRRRQVVVWSLVAALLALGLNPGHAASDGSLFDLLSEDIQKLEENQAAPGGPGGTPKAGGNEANGALVPAATAAEGTGAPAAGGANAGGGAPPPALDAPPPPARAAQAPKVESGMDLAQMAALLTPAPPLTNEADVFVDTGSFGDPCTKPQRIPAGDLAALVARADASETLILLTATMGDLATLANLIWILEQRFGATNYAIGCQDSDLKSWLQDHSMSCFLMQHEATFCPVLREQIVHDLLRQGTNVILTDLDAIWTADLRTPLLSADVVAQRDDVPNKLAKRWGATLTTGLVGLRASPGTAQLALEILWKRYSDFLADQDALNTVLEAHRLRWLGGKKLETKVALSTHADLGQIRLGDQELVVKLLPAEAYRRECVSMNKLLFMADSKVAHCRGGSQGDAEVALLRSRNLYALPADWDQRLHPEPGPSQRFFAPLDAADLLSMDSANFVEGQNPFWLHKRHVKTFGGDHHFHDDAELQEILQKRVCEAGSVILLRAGIDQLELLMNVLWILEGRFKTTCYVPVCMDSDISGWFREQKKFCYEMTDAAGEVLGFLALVRRLLDNGVNALVWDVQSVPVAKVSAMDFQAGGQALDLVGAQQLDMDKLRKAWGAAWRESPLFLRASSGMKAFFREQHDFSGKRLNFALYHNGDLHWDTALPFSGATMEGTITAYSHAFNFSVALAGNKAFLAGSCATGASGTPLPIREDTVFVRCNGGKPGEELKYAELLRQRLLWALPDGWEGKLSRKPDRMFVGSRKGDAIWKAHVAAYVPGKLWDAGNGVPVPLPLPAAGGGPASGASGAIAPEASGAVVPAPATPAEPEEDDEDDEEDAGPAPTASPTNTCNFRDYSDADLEVLTKRADGERNLLLLTSNINYWPVLANLVFLLERRFGVSNFAIGCLDAPMQSKLKNLGKECFLMRDETGACTLGRLQLAEELVRRGYNVMLSDADAVWLTDLRPVLQQAELVAQRDEFPRAQLEKWGATLCSGLLAFRSTPGTQALLARVRRKVRHGYLDQRVFNEVLDELELTWNAGPGGLEVGIHESVTVDKGHLKAPNGDEVHLALLPQDPYRRACTGGNRVHLMSDAAVAHCHAKKTTDSKLSALQSKNLFVLPDGWEVGFVPDPPGPGPNRWFDEAQLEPDWRYERHLRTYSTDGKFAEDRQLQQLLQKVSPRKELVLLEGTIETHRLLLNLVYNLEQRLKITNFGIICSDAELAIRLASQNVFCYETADAQGEVVKDVALLRRVIKNGIKVVYFDPRVQIFQDPLSRVFAGDLFGIRAPPNKRFANADVILSPAVFAVTPTKRMLEFVTVLKGKQFRSVNDALDDQGILWDLDSTHDVLTAPEAIFGQTEDALEVTLAPLEDFATAVCDAGDPALAQSQVLVSCTNADARAQEEYMREQGLWFLPEDFERSCLVGGDKGIFRPCEKVAAQAAAPRPEARPSSTTTTMATPPATVTTTAPPPPAPAVTAATPPPPPPATTTTATSPATVTTSAPPPPPPAVTAAVAPPPPPATTMVPPPPPPAGAAVAPPPPPAVAITASPPPPAPAKVEVAPVAPRPSATVKVAPLPPPPPADASTSDSAQLTSPVEYTDDPDAESSPQHPVFANPPPPAAPTFDAASNAADPNLRHLLSRVDPHGGLVLVPCAVENREFLLNWIFVAEVRLHLHNYAVICVNEEMQTWLRSAGQDCYLLPSPPPSPPHQNLFHLTASLLAAGATTILWADPRSVWLRDVQPYVRDYIEADIVAMHDAHTPPQSVGWGVSLSASFVLFKNSARLRASLLPLFKVTKKTARHFPFPEDRRLNAMLEKLGVTFHAGSQGKIDYAWNGTELLVGQAPAGGLKVALLPQLYFRRLCEPWMTAEDLGLAVVINCRFSAPHGAAPSPRTLANYKALSFFQRRYLWAVPPHPANLIRHGGASHRTFFTAFTDAVARSSQLLNYRTMIAKYPMAHQRNLPHKPVVGAAQAASAATRGGFAHPTAADLDFRYRHLKDRAEDNAIILVPASQEELAVLLNFLFQLEDRFGLTNYAVLCRDAELYAWLAARDAPCYPIFADEARHNRLLVARDLVLDGLHVILSAPSQVWLRNPVADLLAADMVAERERYPKALEKRWGFTLGTNLMGIVSNPPVRGLLRQMGLGTEGDASLNAEKRRFNVALKDLGLIMHTPRESAAFHNLLQADDDTAVLGDVDFIIKKPLKYRKLCESFSAMDAKDVVVASCQVTGAEKEGGMEAFLRNRGVFVLPNDWETRLAPRVSQEEPWLFQKAAAE